MNFKKFIPALSAVLLLSTGCSLDSDPQDNNAEIQYSVCNLVTAADGSAVASTGTYSLTYYYTEGYMTVSTGDLVLSNGNNGFTTSTMPYTENIYSSGVVRSFSGGTVDSNNFTVTNLTGFTSQLANVLYPDDPAINPYPTGFLTPLVMQYTVNNDTQVKTFMRDAIYTGVTTINDQTNGGQLIRENIRYRVYFANDFKKADIIMYKANFSDKMPVEVDFILNDLEVNFAAGGYVISIPTGETRIPMQTNGNPFPAYTFTEFTLTNNSKDLTTCGIIYTIEGANGPLTMATYLGTFNGSYVVSKP